MSRLRGLTEKFVHRRIRPGSKKDLWILITFRRRLWWGRPFRGKRRRKASKITFLWFIPFFRPRARI